MTEYRTVAFDRLQILQYKFVETKTPIFFFLKDRKKVTWLDVPKAYVDGISEDPKAPVLHGTVNSFNTDLADFKSRYPEVYTYLREVYGPQQYLLEEERARYMEMLREKKEFKYRYDR